MIDIWFTLCLITLPLCVLDLRRKGLATPGNVIATIIAAFFCGPLVLLSIMSREKE